MCENRFYIFVPSDLWPVYLKNLLPRLRLSSAVSTKLEVSAALKCIEHDGMIVVCWADIMQSAYLLHTATARDFPTIIID